MVRTAAPCSAGQARYRSSCTATSTVPDLPGRDRISNSRGPSAAASIASMLFIARFQHHLLELYAIAAHWRQASGQGGPHRDPVPSGFTVGYHESFLNGFAEVQPRHGRGRFLYQRAYPRDHLARAVPIIDDAADRFPSLLQIWWSGIEPAQRGISVCDGPCERLIDFVGDGGRQFSHRHHAINMRQLRLSLAQFLSPRPQRFFGPPALGNVLDRAENAARSARCVDRDIALTVNDAHIAIWPDHPVLYVVGRAATQRLRQCRSDSLIILRMDQFLMSRKGYRAFLRRQPEDAVGFFGAANVIFVEVTIPVTDMRHALGFFEFGLALPQVFKHQQTGQGVPHPSTDLQEKPLLLRRPDPRVGALMQSEHVGFVYLRADGHSDQRPYAEILHELCRHRMF